MAEAELLALMRRGDSGAFATLMRDNNRRLYRLARGILRDDGEAEEAVQDSYLHAFTHLESFKGEAKLGTWLARIVMNEALQRLRRRRPTVDLAALDEGGTRSIEAGLAAIDPEIVAARGEVRTLIERAVDRLPANFRTVFMLRAVEQMSIEETAQFLGIPSETVKTRFHRANRLLREMLRDDLAGILDDAFPFQAARCNRLMTRVLARLGHAAPSSAIDQS